jgi:hypothetical protein
VKKKGTIEIVHTHTNILCINRWIGWESELRARKNKSINTNIEISFQNIAKFAIQCVGLWGISTREMRITCPLICSFVKSQESST